MIRHIVMLSLRNDASGSELSDIMGGLEALKKEINGFVSFEHGPNRDFEGKSETYPYGFLCTFENKDALKSYAASPDHQALGARLVALCTGGGHGIFVMDLET